MMTNTVENCGISRVVRRLKAHVKNEGNLMKKMSSIVALFGGGCLVVALTLPLPARALG
jgi:hypothetical protein